MDHVTPKSKSSRAWSDELREGIRTSDEIDRVPIEPEPLAQLRPAAEAFKTRVPRHYLDLVDWNDPEDPIRRQAIPSPRELEFAPHEREDPIGDAAHSPVPRLTHRYPDRVLLFPTYHCALYCRFCFRKESLNDIDQGYSQRALDPAFEYIAEHPELREAIVTGGDPLMLRDDHLAYVRGRLESITHLRLLRVHTRVPAALPQRVTPELVAALRGRLMVAVVTHFNHPREITPQAATACRRLREAGFMLLNQSVLMRGINDDVETLRELFQELVYTLGAKPYYLHHCDLTRGVGHFRTSLDTGRSLMEQLRGDISGLCQPTYVLDLPGGHGKIPVGPNYVRGRDGSRWRFGDPNGAEHAYQEVLEEPKDQG